MIEPNTKQVEAVFNNAKDKLDSVYNIINDISYGIQDKLKLMANEISYSQSYIQSLENKTSTDASDSFIFSYDNDLYGVYDSYGKTIHSKFAKTPKNLFNYKSATGMVFCDNVTVSIDDIVNTKFKSILIHDSIKEQDIAFDEFDNDTIKLTVEIDTGNLLTNTSINVIEICPYLAGSFDINSIEFYTTQSKAIGQLYADSVTNYKIESCGSERIVLDSKLSIYKVVFNIKLKHLNNNSKYPFGLKHLYFLNADFVEDSYAIFPIKTKSYIDYIGDDITIIDAFHSYNDTCTNANIELYKSYDSNNNVLDFRLYTTTNKEENYIASNIDNFFVKIPLINNSLVGLVFNNINLKV